MKNYSFENLEAWKEARNSFIKIYNLTSAFPNEEKYNITSQIRRSSFSVCCNISEGTSRISSKEKSRFLEIAYGSLMETLNGIIIANELNLINTDQYQDVRNDIELVSSKLNGLNNYFKKNP